MKPGNIYDTAGTKRGRHSGLALYTYGQREGLGLGGCAEPLFVVGFDYEKNRLIVGARTEDMTRTFTVKNVNWISESPTKKVLLQVRYRQTPVPATVTNTKGNSAVVTVENALSAITPGQAAVFYEPKRGQKLLGGGLIHSRNEA